jgi:hypothetical protein
MRPLKFDLYPAPALFKAKFRVPDFVAKSAKRTLHILVNGKEIAAYPLDHDGMNEPTFPVPADLISKNNFTLAELNVENPCQTFGVVLLKAAFTYRQDRRFRLSVTKMCRKVKVRVSGIDERRLCRQHRTPVARRMGPVYDPRRMGHKRPRTVGLTVIDEIA